MLKHSPAEDARLPLEHLRERFDAFAHAQYMLRQCKSAAGFDQGNYTIEIWTGMGTSNHDPNWMK